MSREYRKKANNGKKVGKKTDPFSESVFLHFIYFA